MQPLLCFVLFSLGSDHIQQASKIDYGMNFFKNQLSTFEYLPHKYFPNKHTHTGKFTRTSCDDAVIASVMALYFTNKYIADVGTYPTIAEYAMVKFINGFGDTEIIS